VWPHFFSFGIIFSVLWCLLICTQHRAQFCRHSDTVIHGKARVLQNIIVEDILHNCLYQMLIYSFQKFFFVILCSEKRHGVMYPLRLWEQTWCHVPSKFVRKDMSCTPQVCEERHDVMYPPSLWEKTWCHVFSFIAHFCTPFCKEAQVFYWKKEIVCIRVKAYRRCVLDSRDVCIFLFLF